eukprot:m.336679 g.336679  ORF g.336679 m.336679 type:complete len:408 (+) comp17927_c0_seq1:152-1375(+)
MVDPSEAHEAPSVATIVKNMTYATMGVMGLCGVFTIATIVIFYIHKFSILRKTPQYSRTRACTIVIIRMGVIFSVTSYLALWFPRSAMLFELLRRLSEAHAIYSFVTLTISLLDIYCEKPRAQAVLGASGERPSNGMLYQDHVDNYDDVEIVLIPSAIQHAAQWLATTKPRRLRASPPCCCLYCCVHERRWTEPFLRRCRMLSLQYCYVVPTLTICSLWTQLEDAYLTEEESLSRKNDFVLAQFIFLCLQVASVMTAMHGLLTLHLTVRELLPQLKLDAKLIAIKLIVSLGALQSLILVLTIDTSHVDEEHNQWQLFLPSYRETGYENFLLCVESLPLAILLYKSFPADELVAHTAMDEKNRTFKVGDYLKNGLPDPNGAVSYGTANESLPLIRETTPVAHLVSEKQ